MKNNYKSIFNIIKVYKLISISIILKKQYITKIYFWNLTEIGSDKYDFF